MRCITLICAAVVLVLVGQRSAVGQKTADSRDRDWTPLVSTVAGAASPDGVKTPAGAHEQLDSALWVQTSGEFYAIARQTFAGAAEKLDLALRDSTWTAATEQFTKGNYQDLPPAVIVNLDETVWNNSPYQARIILQYGQHDMVHFVEWCNEAKCSAVPGAKEFLEHVKKQGVTIAYITPRPELTRDGTLRNLAPAELPVRSASGLAADGWRMAESRQAGDDRRKHRILLIVSDSLGDFMHDTAQDASVRREMAAQYADNWGLKWFLIPNPMYGHWEYSFQQYDYDLDRATRIQNKLRALDPEVDNPPVGGGNRKAGRADRWTVFQSLTLSLSRWPNRLGRSGMIFLSRLRSRVGLGRLVERGR